MLFRSAGLFSIGIPKDSVIKYETALKADKFIVVAHGTAAEVARVRDVMQTTQPSELVVHGIGHNEHRAASA